MVVLEEALEPTLTVLFPAPLPTLMVCVPVPPKLTTPVLVPVPIFTAKLELLLRETIPPEVVKIESFVMPEMPVIVPEASMPQSDVLICAVPKPPPIDTVPVLVPVPTWES